MKQDLYRRITKKSELMFVHSDETDSGGSRFGKGGFMRMRIDAMLLLF